MENKRRLKNRKNLSTAIRTDLLDNLKALSIKTNTAMSKLLDEALEDLTKKHSNSAEK